MYCDCDGASESALGLYLETDKLAVGTGWRGLGTFRNISLKFDCVIAWAKSGDPHPVNQSSSSVDDAQIPTYKKTSLKFGILNSNYRRSVGFAIVS